MGNEEPNAPLRRLSRNINAAAPAPPPMHGARRLWLAVLELAIMDLGRIGSLAHDARRYFTEDDPSYLGSYRSICDELDLEPTTVRAWIGARLNQPSHPHPGIHRQAFLGGRTPQQRRILSATIRRQCVQCEVWFTTYWRQQRACSKRCSHRQWRKVHGGG